MHHTYARDTYRDILAHDKASVSVPLRIAQTGESEP